MTRRIFIVVLACVAGVACNKESSSEQAKAPNPGVVTAAVAPVPQDLASRVAALLSRDGGTVTRDEWRALGPEAFALLDRVVSDQVRALDERVRAIAALAFVDDDTAQDRLGELLADPNPEVRKAAVRALTVTGGAKAQTSLEDRLQEEDSAEIRELIQQSLTRMQP